MSLFKCTALFSLVTNTDGTAKGNRQGGWSESVYFDGLEANLVSRFEALCARRALLLGTATDLIGQRYQKIDPVGRAVQGSKRFPGQNVLENDVPQMALMFNMFSTTGLNSRRFTLRGLPDEYVHQGEWKPTPSATSNFNQYCNALAPFSMKASRKDTAKAPLVSIAVDGTFILQQPLAFAANDYLTVSGAKVIGGTANGRFHVQTFTDTQHGKFSNWVSGASIGGEVKLDETFYPAFENTATTGAFPNPKVVVRKVGRPFGGYVGRASRRA